MKSHRRTPTTDDGVSAMTAWSAVDHEAGVAVNPGSDRMLSHGHGGAMRRFSPGAALVVGLGAAVLTSYNFGSRLLITNDDTRFPVLARDALTNGNWLIPAMPDGRPHVVKPPLAAWLIALASWPEGHVTVRTAVLPSLLAALGVVLLTYWLGRRFFGASAGIAAGLTVATMVGMYTMAHSPMPDMLQLLAGTGAIAAYVASGFGAAPTMLVLFYAVIGLGSLAKGAPGFVPLVVAILDAFIAERLVGLKRLISLPGLVGLVAIAVPWWIAAAAYVGYGRFLSEYVLGDQARYFARSGRYGWAAAAPLGFAITVLLPWGVLLPLAVRRAVRERDPDTQRRVRLLLVWMTTVFVIMAVSGQQRERYYLPLCPVAALLIGWWYSTLAWRWRARAFAGAWVAVVAVGAVAVTLDTPRYNATTDLRAVRAALQSAPTRVFALDLQDLAVSFNLDRPVVNCKNYQSCEQRVRNGEGRYVLISDRMLEQQPVGTCLRPVATGMVTRRPLTVLDPTLCAQTGSAASGRPPG